MSKLFIFAGLALPFTLFAPVNGKAQEAEQPYFKPPRYVGVPKAEHSVTNRAFQGISSMAVTPKGRLWTTWYAGITPAEDHNNYVVLATSADGGKTWKEVLVVDPDAGAPVRAYDPELWIAPNGKMSLFWAQGAGKNCQIAGVWAMEASDLESEQPNWSEPRRLSDGVMMCKPIALSTGEWALPCSTWYSSDSAKVVVSVDQGKSWAVRGSCNTDKAERTCDEHMLVERKDGSLWMLIRTRSGIAESSSTDKGVTWPESQPSSIQHPSARFFITRLQSGNLLMVKHGPINKKTERSHLMAFISKDDGKTWEGGLLLDERATISYPDGQQAADGTIYITYDFNRTADREIYFASFREEDALSGTAKTPSVRLKQLISKASGGNTKVSADISEVEQNDGGETIASEPFGEWKALGGGDVDVLSEGARLFSDREHRISNVPDVLRNAKFIRMSISGDKTIKCAKEGTLFFLTPTPKRNADSQTKTLEAQGFAKVALPEIPLFAPQSKRNWVTLYQKKCAAGEEYQFGMWAVPFFLETASGK